MRTADAATIATLLGPGPILRADLYTFTLNNGTVLRLTNADINMTVGGHLFIKGPTLKRSATKQSIGTSVDSITVELFDPNSYTISGSPIIHQIRRGLFKRAHVLVQKMYLDSWTDLSRAPVDWFEGRVSDVQTQAMAAQLRINSPLDLLTTQMPLYLYQPPCVHSLYDTGCGLSAAAFTFTYAAAGGSTASVLNLTGTVKADGYYALGKVYFTSGPNAGQPARTIKSYVSGVATVFNPFPFTPGVGDACKLVAGCDKTQATCASSKFNNAPNFRGYRFIPVPETALEGGSTPGSGTGAAGGTGQPPVGSGSSARTGAGSYPI